MQPAGGIKIAFAKIFEANCPNILVLMSKLRNADNDIVAAAPVHVAPHDPRHLLHLGPGALQPREPRIVHS